MNDLVDVSNPTLGDPTLKRREAFPRKLSDGGKIHKAINNFTSNLNGIIFALNSLEETMQPRSKVASRSLTKFFQDHKGEMISEKAGDGYKIEFPRRLSTELMSLMKARHVVETGNASLKKALLLALVSHWDSYISSSY